MSRLTGALLMLFFATAALAVPANAVEPARFHSGGTVSGGHGDQEATLLRVRFGEHDGFHRTVLDYGSGAAGENHGYINRHPSYVVEYRENPARLNVYFNHVYAEPSTRVLQTDRLPTDIITDGSGRIYKLTVHLPGPSEFRVIEVDDPSRLAIDVRKRRTASTEERVYALQMFGFDSLDRAVELLRSGKLDDGEFDIFIDGNRPLLEATYNSLGSASARAVKIEKQYPGVEVVVNERAGNSLPSI